MTIVFSILFVFTIAYTFVYKRDPISPARIFILTYSALLAIYCLKFSMFQTPWSPTTIMIFGGACACFIGGCITVILLGKIAGPQIDFSFKAIKQDLHNDAASVDWNHFLMIWLLCTAVFIGIFIWNTLHMGYIPMFAENPGEARITFLEDNIYIGVGWFFGPLSLMMMAEMLIFGKLKGAKLFLSLAISTIVLLLYVTLVTRYDLIRFVLFAIIIFHYGKRNISLSHMALLLAAGLILFMGMFLVRTSYDTLGTLSDMLRMRMPPGLGWAGSIYSYAVCSFWNLDYVVQKYVEGVGSYPLGFGYELFSWFLFFTQLQGPFVAMFGFDTIYNESAVKVSGYNTINFVWPFFKDFGVVGVFLLPLLFGLLISFFYANTMKKPTVFRIALWSLFAPCILLSFHSALWEYWFLYMNIFFFMLAHKKLTLT
jgi:oligosaccharide repeat unit polymerase